jgi:hypothetical protein
VKIMVTPILDRGSIDLGNEPACFCKSRAVDPRTVTDRHEFPRGLAGMLAAPSADIDPEFAG